MKKTLLSLLCALALLLCALPPALAQETVVGADDDTGLDIVVLIDRSGSMDGSNGTDPEGIALAATNMLADIADPQTTQIAVIGFGFDIRKDTGFKDLSNEEDLQSLKADVSSMKKLFHSQDDTDTGKALARAKEIIGYRRTQHPDHSYAILVLSDGKIDIRNYEEGIKKVKNETGMTAEEQKEQSVALAKEVAEWCGQNGVTISCLGIYPGDDTSKLGTDMKDWTEVTGGTYKVTNDINNTYDLIEEIYMNIKGQANDRFPIGPDGLFSIPAGVSTANIRAIPGTDFDNISLEYDDAGEWEDYAPDEVTGGKDSSSTVIKLYRPKKGDYRISFKEGEMAKFELDITYDRELVMTLQAPASMRNLETTSDILLDVQRHGHPYYDANGEQPVIHVLDESGQTVLQDLPAQWDAEKAQYTASFTPTLPVTYTLRATQELNGENVSNDVQIEVGKASIYKANDFGEIKFTGHAIRKYDENGNSSEGYDPVVIDLKNGGYFADPDGVLIVDFELRLNDPNDSQYADIVYDPAAKTLTITPKNQTTAPIGFTVSATPAEGVPSEPASGTITIEDLQAPARVSDAAAAIIPDNVITIKAMLPQKEPTPVVDNVLDLFVEPNANADGEAVVLDSIESSDGGDKVEILQDGKDGNRLLLRALKEGDTTVVVTARSYDGSSCEYRINVHVENQLKTYLMIGGGVLLALALVGIIVAAIASANKPRFKKNTILGVRLCSEDDDQEGSCILLRYGKGPAKMTDLCVQCGISTMGMRKQLEAIRVYPRRTSSIEIRYKNKGKNVTSVLSNNDSKEITLDAEGDRMLILTYIEEELDNYD